jgi:subtilisin family serine protease
VLRFYPDGVLRPPSVTKPRAERDKTRSGVGGRSAAQCSAASFLFLRPLSRYPQDVAGRDRSRPQHEPPPLRGRRRHPYLLAAFAAFLLGGASPARADLCIDVDPLVAIGCGSASTRAASSAPAPNAAASVEAVALSPTTVEYDPERIAVTVKPSASSREIAAAFADADVRVEETVAPIHAYLVHVAPERQAAAVTSLRSSPVIARAGPDVVAHALDTTPNDEEWPLQAGLRVIGLPRAWDTIRGSPRLVVAVVDTGVDDSQPDLRGALVPGVNLVDRTAPPRDDHGHGTAVAGIVAARSNNAYGMTGVCWFCSVMPVKVLDASGSGDDTRIGAGIVWAADHGARVINLSLGGPGDTAELDAALAYATSKGAVVVAAAGNSGTTIPFYPAANATALSVAATTTADHAYSWSNFGTWVDVAAPGCNVAPARASGYSLFCGTSSATPIVSGLAALALSERPAATPADVRHAVETGTAPLPGFVQFGRVSAPGALAALASVPVRAAQVLNATLTRTHSAQSYDVQAAPGSLSATLQFRAGALATVTVQSLDDGTRVAALTGRSPLRLTTPVPGPVKVTVRGRGRFPLRVVLRLSFGGGGGA